MGLEQVGSSSSINLHCVVVPAPTLTPIVAATACPCCSQTAESTPLPAFVWPRRSVLVLGREKEGLPAEIISMLDAAVEIPQCGVIRSLNVHVSGAIAMFEYAKQHTSKAGGGSGST